MASEVSRSQGLARYSLWIRQLLLVLLMIGLEANVTMETILMIANIQTLGVPIKYSSLPGTISAAIGMILIPTLGVVMDKWGQSKGAKAKILICTSCLQLVGGVLIFLANTIKLLYYDDDPLSDQNSSIISSTHLAVNSNYTQWTISSQVDYSLTNSMNQTLDSFKYLVHATTVDPGVLQPSGEDIRYYAILAMAGFALVDCGYDSSNCFLKTFALASIPLRDHSSIIVKSILVSSFGGCFIAVLGSIGLGGVLTAGTSHDKNAAQSALISGLCVMLVFFGLISTLTTGFCCPPSDASSLEESSTSSTQSLTVDEKSHLIGSKRPSHDFTSSGHTWKYSEGTASNIVEHIKSDPLSHDKATTKVTTATEVSDIQHKNRIVRFMVKQKKQILINISTFFLLGALYSFEVYSVNFVGQGIFDGDPLADVSSEEYERYLHGIEVGSIGTLIYYVSFTVGNIFQETMLAKIGWKVELIAFCAVYVIINLVCAITGSLWVFYICAVWTGLFRTAAVTIPYILANQFATEQNSENTGFAIAMVAAMLPCSFTLCSAIMGPLIDATDNPAVSIYYTAVNSFLAIIVICFLK